VQYRVNERSGGQSAGRIAGRAGGHQSDMCKEGLEVKVPCSKKAWSSKCEVKRRPAGLVKVPCVEKTCRSKLCV